MTFDSGGLVSWELARPRQKKKSREKPKSHAAWLRAKTLGWHSAAFGEDGLLLLPSPHNTHPSAHRASGVPLSHLPLGQKTARKPLAVKAVATPGRCVEEVSISAFKDWRRVGICTLDNAKAGAG